MSERALADKRPWLVASLLAGISYYFARTGQVPGLYLMAWKGAGVALLAAYALARHKGADLRQIAAVMAFGALGDVLIELVLEWGAVAFLIGHLIAIRLYWRHRRARLELSQKLAALAFAILIPAISFLLPADRAAAPGVALYALGLGAMTAAAWTSSFSRLPVVCQSSSVRKGMKGWRRIMLWSRTQAIVARVSCASGPSKSGLANSTYQSQTLPQTNL